MCSIAGNVQRHPVQLLPIAADEVLPGALVPGRAGTRQRQLLQMKSAAEFICLFRRRWRVMREILAQNFTQDFRESLRTNAINGGATALVKSRGGVCAVAELRGSRGILDRHSLHDASNNFDARKNKSCVLYLRARAQEKKTDSPRWLAPSPPARVRVGVPGAAAGGIEVLQKRKS